MSNKGIGTCPRLNFFHLFEFSPTQTALLSKCRGLLRHLSKTFVHVISVKAILAACPSLLGGIVHLHVHPLFGFLCFMLYVLA